MMPRLRQLPRNISIRAPRDSLARPLCASWLKWMVDITPPETLLTGGGMEPVLLSLAEWAWLNRERPGVADRYREYVDWLIEEDPVLAEEALTTMEMYPWSSLGG